MSRKSNAHLARTLTAVIAEHPTLSTQRALARRSGIGQRTISRICRGEASPRVDTIERLADVLGVDVAMFLRRRRRIR